jgi:hypothetical protein
MSPWRQKLISAFIIWNIFAILVGKNFEGTWASRLTYPYLVWTRLLQEWQLFVPGPRTFAMKYRAEIEMDNGKTAIWQRPYPPNWDFFERHKAYHFQKWDLATQQLEKYRGLWLDLAEFLEREYAAFDLKPVRMKWIQSTARRPPPNPSGYVMSGDDVLQWQDKIVFEYDYLTRSLSP